MSQRGWLGCQIRPLDVKNKSPATFFKAPVALRRLLILHAGLRKRGMCMRKRGMFEKEGYV